jgi:hypothetical protein
MSDGVCADRLPRAMGDASERPPLAAPELSGNLLKSI